MSKLLNLEVMSKATQTKIRAEAGVRTTKKLIKEAREQGGLGWRATKNDERRAFEYFGGIYNERVHAEQDDRREIAREIKNQKARKARKEQSAEKKLIVKIENDKPDWSLLKIHDILEKNKGK